MFEGFTDEGRSVVQVARDEASRLQHGYIGPEHLLLGLLHPQGSIANEMLARFGLTAEAVRGQIVAIVGLRDGPRPSGAQIPFTPRAKRALEMGLRERLTLGHAQIGPEHLLLGLIREPEGVAVQVLTGAGIELGALRRAVLERAPRQPQAAAAHAAREASVQRHLARTRAWSSPKPQSEVALGVAQPERSGMLQSVFERFTERARQVVVKAQEEARALNYDYIGSEHLLLALAAEPDDDLSAAILTSLRVDTQKLRGEIDNNVDGESEPILGQIPFKPMAKQALELGLRESLALGHNYVGTEHVLLGLFSGPLNKATRLLLDANITPEQVREARIERLVTRSGSGGATGSAATAGVVSPGPPIRTTNELSASFHVRPDDQLRHALQAAAARALREGRNQYGLADLKAVTDADS